MQASPALDRLSMWPLFHPQSYGVKERRQFGVSQDCQDWCKVRHRSASVILKCFGVKSPFMFLESSNLL